MADVKKIGMFFLFSMLTILVFMSYKKIEIKKLKKNKISDMKTVLFWTPMFGHNDFYLGLGSELFENCKYKHCFLTDNRSYMPVESFDAIVFHGVEYTFERFGKPENRPPSQIYIYGNLESPIYTHVNISSFNNFYNLTMTYRRDSDIIRPYGSFYETTTNYTPPTIEEIQKRPKKIAWFVSRCQSSSKRELLVEKLQKHLPIDIYGNCHTLRCPRSRSDECYDILEKDYKFYLSFENSICEEYVTEKLYFVLKKNVIPIVYGGGPYDTFSPPNSVINVMNFTSLDKFVDYIKFLDAHPEEYLKYFQWKKKFVIDTSDERLACSLCQKLHEKIEAKSYNSIYEWWYGKSDSMCSNKFIDKILS